uniref:Uncharacterized protein n=1 Tax=Ganoderma boninense TaxID=34458 RepID=A0A5K1K3R4_9APHY|nr:Eukaryotic translation initiation factor 3 subunit G (eIF3g) (Eukaryotic translation initiation factor 3 RNA-binding subunit) (eIF-3 RNA-binding subunit) (Translation initiation factor eIF3 p33 subunit homolog) (eIF3 p33 homolog) [Ganoderma boninense]
MSGYDERLLASAPAATRAEKQVRPTFFAFCRLPIFPRASSTLVYEGYNIDLLEGRSGARSNSATPPPASAAPLSTDHSKAEAGGYAGSARNGYTTSGAASKPWYKTRKGLIIIFVVAIVVVAAVVGGAVGGTVGHKNNDNATTPSVGAGGGGAGGEGGQAATKTSTETAEGGGGGPATTTSSPAATTSSNSGGGGGGGGGVGGIGSVSDQETADTQAHAQPTAPSVADAAGAGAA